MLLGLAGNQQDPMDPPVYHDNIEQGTAEWHQIRCGVITASGMKALITPGLKPADNATSRTYLRRLLAERIIGHPEEGVCTFKMERGHTLEPFAREIYSQHVKKPVTECGFITRDVGGVTLGYSPDGLVGNDGLIEIKSRDGQNTLNSILNPVLPAEHAIQVYTGLLVSGRAYCKFLSYTPGLPLFSHCAQPDETIFQAIIKAAIVAQLKLEEMHKTYAEQALKYPMTDYIDLSSQETPWD